MSLSVTINKLNSYLLQINNKYIFIFILMVLLLLLAVPLSLIGNFFRLKMENPINDKGIVYQFINGIIIAPFFETLIFQIGIIKSLLYLNKGKSLIILISAFFFGISHFYNIYYVIYSFFIGMFFANVYFLSINKKLNPFTVIFTLHALLNLIVFININTI